MNAIQFLASLRPALPYSTGKTETPMPASNGELRTWMKDGSVLVNNEKIEPGEEIDFPVFSLVFFPKSERKRTTLV